MKATVIGATIERLDRAEHTWHWAAFAGLLAVAIIVRIAAFQGYANSDPRMYTEIANDLSRGIWDIRADRGAPVFPIRPGIYVPTAVLIKMFGLSGLTLGAYPLIISMGSCLLTYFLARRFFSPLAGLLAFGAAAIVSIDVWMASALWPDAIAAFWANVGVTLALCLLSKSRPLPAVMLGLVSGVLFGVSWLCKETVVYLVPFVGVLALVVKRQTPLSTRVACVTAIAVGSLAILSGETVFYAKQTGDLLFHFHTTERNYESWPGGFFDASSRSALVQRLLGRGLVEMLGDPSMSFVPMFAVLAIIWAVIFRQRKFLIPAVWLTSLLLMFNFMTSSFRSYKPLVLFGRYFYPILLPSLILFGGFLATLLLGESEYQLRRERRFWAVAVIVVFCAISAAGVRRTVLFKPQDVQRSVASRLQPSDIIYTDYRTAPDLIFFRTGRLLRSDTNTIRWDNVDPKELPKGAYVLVNWPILDFEKQAYNVKIPAFASNPPSVWTKVQSFDNADLYLVPR